MCFAKQAYLQHHTEASKDADLQAQSTVRTEPFRAYTDQQPFAIFNPFIPALNCFNHCFNALTEEKQQIYKLAARHSVPRCELVYLLFFIC